MRLIVAMFDTAPSHAPPAPLQQSEAFARALGEIGQAPVQLDSGAVLLRRRWGPVRAHMLSRGAADAFELHLAELRTVGVRGPVILAPDGPVKTAGLPVVPLVSPAYVAELDLTPPLDALRAGLHQKWRNRLKHAGRQDLRITRQNMPDMPDHWLLLAEQAQQSARGYRNWPAALTCAFARVNRGDAKLFTAHFGKAPVAGLLVLRHGDCATYHIGHSRPAGRMTSAHTLLMWEAIRWLKRKEVRHLDLGLIDTEEGAGLARFKLGTGAAVRALGGTWLWWPPATRLTRPLKYLDRKMMQTIDGK